MDILRGKACMLVACVLAMAFVIEAEPPTFTSCRNYITPAAGELPQAVNFPLPEAQDPGGNLVQVSCSHRPGDKFPLGKTQVTCNATVGSETSTCKFKVGVGDGVNCTRDLNKCVCRGETCTCFKGFTGIDCAIEDGTVCTGPSTPSDGCGNTCPAVSCRCERGWEGPSCNVVDDGSSCFSGVGSPPHCEECFIGDSPPCICEKGWQGIRCENDYLPPVFVSCPPDIFMKAGSGEDRAVVTWDDPRAVDNSGAEPNIVCDRTSGSWFSGTSLVTCTASDGTGNSVSDCIFNVTVTDEKAPVMTCPASGSWNVDSGADVATVIWSPLPEATDNIDGKLQVTCTDALGNVVNSGDEFLVGETSVFCLASDKSGNQGRCGFSITVVDNEGPIVTCPSSVTQNVETGKADAAVKWSPLPSAEDAVEGPVPTVVCTDEGGKAAESGNRFPAGNTMVTCSAMDSVGNKGNCSFLIIILDNEAPIMTCPDDIVRNVDAGKAVATVDWPIMPQANDTVDGLLAVTCSDGSGGLVSSGDEFPVDVTMVTCTASDTSHNEGTCSFLITVIDNEDPFIACPENIFQDLDAGSDVGTVHWPTQPSANDTVDGSLAVTCTDDSGIVVKSGDTFSVGATIVTCKAIDGSGNEANCSFTINLKACEPCQNGGHSQDPDTCACQCPEVYAGLLCSECKECVNGGNQDKDTCVCDCFNSYMGVLCDVCPPDIKCDNAGQFEEAACRCNCPPPWTGPTCSECIPCAHGGTDQDPDTCLCDCPGAYLPPVCAACGGQAECQNGGEFSEVSCNCTCPSPFTGKTCTECEPCQNGGSYQNKFTCVCDCPYFHTDPLCAVCPLGFVCLNGGTRREATCSCECANGWRAKDCSERVPNVPDDEYPVSPIWTVVKKKVSFEIAVIAPIYNGTVCDPRISKFSDACIALVTEFKLSVEIEYKFVAGFSQVVINQEDLRAGSVVVPHEVIYNYEEMTPTTRGISANALYGETVGKAVVRGYIGKLKVATGCEDCMAPQDHTYICDAEPPDCAPGLMLTERAEGGEGTCYYVCRSKCKLDTTYCGDGTCRQEQGSKDISCSCPQSSTVMYSGAQCQNQIQLTWLYVGVSVGVVSILVLIVVLSVCLWRSKGLVDRLQEEDEEKVVLGKPMSDELMKELNSYCNNNNGSTGETYFHKPPSGESTRPSLYAQISQEHKRNRAIKNGQAPGAGSGAKVGGLRAHLSPGSPKYEAQIKPNDFDGSRSPRGERRPWYFWGKMSLPKKRDIKMIPMTSETGRF